MSRAPAQVPEEALILIRRYEGFLEVVPGSSPVLVQPYLCPARVPTIGWGSTFYEDRRKVRMTDQAIDRARADELLEFEVGLSARAVDRLVRVDLDDAQRGALISFVYNCGGGAFARSTLLKRINAKRWAEVPRELAKWRMGGGRILRGLERRRAAEAALFVAGAARLQSIGAWHTTIERAPTRRVRRGVWARIKRGLGLGG